MGKNGSNPLPRHQILQGFTEHLACKVSGTQVAGLCARLDGMCAASTPHIAPGCDAASRSALSGPQGNIGYALLAVVQVQGPCVHGPQVRFFGRPGGRRGANDAPCAVSDAAPRRVQAQHAIHTLILQGTESVAAVMQHWEGHTPHAHMAPAHPRPLARGGPSQGFEGVYKPCGVLQCFCHHFL